MGTSRYTTSEIFAAASRGDLKVLEECGGEFCAALRNATGQTPLMAASAYGATAAVEWLLQNGSDPNSQDDEAESALFHASMFHGPEVAQIIDMLLEAGADILHRDVLGRTPLIAALSHGMNTAAAHVLIARKADLNAATHDKEAALTYAIVWNDIPMLETLLQAGADVGWRSSTGATLLSYALDPLSDASPQDVARIVRILLHYGADPDIPIPYLGSALLMAIRARNEEAALQLLQRSHRNDRLREALLLAQKHELGAVAAALTERLRE